LANVDRFMSGFEQRPDIELELVRGPKPLDTDGSISGTATLDTSVVSASELTSLDFEIRVKWKQRDADFFPEILGDDAVAAAAGA